MHDGIAAPSPDLHRIAHRFEAHADEYDAHAHIQQKTATLLDERFARFIDDAPIRTIADLGCGTGDFTKRVALRFPAAAIIACDISRAMIERMQQKLGPPGAGILSRVTPLCTNAESATFDPPCDAIVSNLCMQWFHDPLHALAHHARRTRFLACTTLVAGTFATWIRAHEPLQMQHGVRPFLEPSALAAAMQGLKPLRSALFVDRFEEPHASALTFLRKLRAIGATTPRDQHQPVSLRPVLRMLPGAFIAEYEVATVLLEMRDVNARTSDG